MSRLLNLKESKPVFNGSAIVPILEVWTLDLQARSVERRFNAGDLRLRRQCHAWIESWRNRLGLLCDGHCRHVHLGYDNARVRLVQPRQLFASRLQSGHRYQQRWVNDGVKGVSGEVHIPLLILDVSVPQACKGRASHTHQPFFAFLHNGDITENSGVFVPRTHCLVLESPKGNAALEAPAADLTQMDPALAQPNPAEAWRAHLIMTVVKGPKKGYVGRIKDTNGNIARVELLGANKVVSINKEKPRNILPDDKL
ncbi:hypothetical protein FA13DRAFT_1711825 [Coprinellus micaceus]|uniref:Spt5 KOW domain-containing protein n=1 Tax=Coprinellus micaceus TaxID=71717 RepID=A0A4Y7T324_COPMI|nr:hypothetical protein FA13DRAFT_1711825 [Coprinellus micaceus]